MCISPCVRDIPAAETSLGLCPWPKHRMDPSRRETACRNPGFRELHQSRAAQGPFLFILFDPAPAALQKRHLISTACLWHGHQATDRPPISSIWRGKNIQRYLLFASSSFRQNTQLVTSGEKHSSLLDGNGPVTSLHLSDVDG